MVGNSCRIVSNRVRRPRLLKKRVLSSEDIASERSPSPLCFIPTSVSNLFSTDRECRGFNYFCTHTIQELSGNFRHGVWAQHLLQAAQVEPAIRCAAVALGALHQSVAETEGRENNFAIRQYVKAIGELVKPLKDRGQQAADIVLLTCILFVCFENLRGQHGAAIAHIDGGIKILTSARNGNRANPTLPFSSRPYVSTMELSLIFGRLDTQAGTVVRDWERGRIQLSSASGPEVVIPTVFPSLEVASDTLESFRLNALREIDMAIQQFGKGAEKTNYSLSLIKIKYQLRMKLWRQSLDRFLRQHPPLDHDTLIEIHILTMWRLLIDISLAALGDVDVDCCWDPFTTSFDKVVEHAAFVIANDHKGVVLSMNVGITLPLFFTALRCRDGVTRRKAIALMRASNRQEGIYNSHLTARMAERVVDMEEAGLTGVIKPEHIPKARRIAGIDTRYEKEARKAFLRYQYGPSAEQVQAEIFEGRTGCEEWIEW